MAKILGDRYMRYGPVTMKLTEEHFDGLSVSFDGEIIDLRLTTEQLLLMPYVEMTRYLPIITIVDEPIPVGDVVIQGTPFDAA